MILDTDASPLAAAMTNTEPQEDSKLARLRAEAEAEMRRTLPGSRPAKRHKKGTSSSGGDAPALGPTAALGGRFDYGALKALPTGLQGFLLTCPLQRENSARKEALPILQQYLSKTIVGDGSGGAAAPAPASEATPAAPASPEEQQGPAAGAANEAAHSLAAIKVGARGVVAFRLVQPSSAGNGTGSNPAACGAGGVAAAAAALAPASADACSGSPEAISHPGADAAGAAHVQRAVAALLADIAAGSQPRLAHVQRVIPVQTTCRMERAALEAAGARLAALVAAALPGGNATEGSDTGTAADPVPGPTSRAAHKVTFGISLKQRALDGAGGKPAEPTAAAPAAADKEAAGGQPGEAGVATVAPAAAPNNSEGTAPIDRGAIISALAGGFEAALRQAHGCEAAVDLKQPGWVLVVEALPAAGSLYAALSALPADLCVFKPKLHIKPVGKA